MAICIIPARGNSKRLPGKNLLNFRGKPLVQIAAEKAVSAGCFDKVIVTSEANEILEIARGIPGVIASIRPGKLSEDDVRADDVIRWELSKNSENFDTVVCCLLPTTPLLSPETLLAAARQYTEGVLFGVIPTSESPFRSFELEQDGVTLRALFPEMLNLQSQSYAKTVVDAGQFYFARANIWQQNFSITACREAKGYVLDPKSAIDINYPQDWQKLVGEF